MTNLAEILRYNFEASRKGQSPQRGINAFTDMTIEEFLSLMTSQQTLGDPSRVDSVIEEWQMPSNQTDLPSSIDWRKEVP